MTHDVPGLTVKTNTSLTQLNHFLENAKEGQTILARHDSRGNTVLYTKSDHAMILDRILGRKDRRQDRARVTIELVFNRFAEVNTRAGQTGEAGTKALFGHIGNRLSVMTSEGGIHVGDARKLVTTTIAVLRAMPDGTNAVADQPKGPTLRTLGMTASDVEISVAAREIAKGAPDWDMAATLGKHMANTFLAKKPTDAQRQAFAFSGAMALKMELKQALQAAAKEMKLEISLGEFSMDTFVEHAVNDAASRIFPDGIADGKTTIAVGRNSLTLPNIKMNGHEYKLSGFLGRGGFANAYEYVRIDDPDSKIAFKVGRHDDDTIKSHADGIDGAAREIDIHNSAYGKGCDQILGLKGAVRLPDGRIGIALEIAPNGTVDGMADKIRDAIGKGPGKITEAEANVLRLTMLQDMARGLHHMHDTRGVTHYDFKSPNCFIGADGVVKVADFGLSLDKIDEHGTTRRDDAGEVDNALFKAPELVRADDVRYRLNKLEKETTSFETDQARKKLEQLLPNAGETVLETLTESVMAPRRDDLQNDKKADQSGLFFGREVDIWGMGASALHMFTGHFPLRHTVEDPKKFSSLQAIKILNDFGANRNSEPLSGLDQDGRPKAGSVGLKTENELINHLLSGMLRPDSGDRLTAKDVINHQAMATKGVGSPEAKALIVALHSNDADRIDAARLALGGVM